MAFFELDQGMLTEIPSPIIGEEPDNNFNFFECRDINNDGYADLTVFPFTQSWNDLRLEEAGKPIFFHKRSTGELSEPQYIHAARTLLRRGRRPAEHDK